MGDLRIQQGERHTVSNFYINPDSDAALLKLSVRTRHQDWVVPYGVGEPPRGSVVEVRGWGITERNYNTPAQTLQYSTHTVQPDDDANFNPPLNWGPRNSFMRLSSIDGILTSGDSGAGVYYLGLICGVNNGGNAPTGTSYALKTAYLAGWITATASVGPSGRCVPPDPNKKKKGIRARVMALGGFLTQGLIPSVNDKLADSYRDVLDAELANTDLEVNFVGSQTNGNPPANSYEGGAATELIHDTEELAKCKIYDYAPDFVTLEAGEKDLLDSSTAPGAASRVDSLISTIQHVSPRTIVLVASAPINKFPAIEARTEEFNSTLRQIVQARKNAGEHVDFVDLATATLNDTIADTAGRTIFNEAGYFKMAGLFALAIENATEAGWIADTLSLHKDLCNGIGPRSNSSLRLMPLGDSITYGFLSSTGNGYRGPLRSSLVNEGFSADFVGEHADGSMYDNYHDGFSGYRIDTVDSFVGSPISKYRPNVVTLMLGTNDMNQNYQLATAADRLGKIIDDVLSNGPDAAVLVASLVPSTDPAVEAAIQAFNAKVPGVVQARASQGKHVAFVDMGGVTTADLADRLHPNDSGYQKIGDAFNSAVQQAQGAGWISDPVPCASIPVGCSDAAILAGGDPAGTNPNGGTGSAPPSGPPPPAIPVPPVSPKQPGPLGTRGGWNGQGQIATGLAPGANVRYADINGDGKADYLVIDPATGAIDAWVNNGTDAAGSNGWTPWGRIATGLAPSANVRIADFNGDKKADYLVLDPKSGVVHAWINHGTDHAGAGGWIEQGQVAAGVGSPGANVQFADINGDGYADYLVIDPATGAIDGWLNDGGDSPGSHGWIGQNRLALGVGATGANVRIADINNDGWADYLVIDPATGGVTAWLNGGGDANSWTWTKLGKIATGFSNPGVTVQFADINGDGKADYLLVGDSSGATQAWLNNGGDADVSGTGTGGWISVGHIGFGVGISSNVGTVQFADIDGDKKVDYLVVDKNTGSVKAWMNGGANGSAAGGWNWTPVGTVAYGVGASGDRVRFADIDGDGHADYLVLDPNTGAVSASLNKGFGGSGGINWTPNTLIAGGVGAPTNTYTLFAHANGSRLADYLVVDINSGAVKAWLNEGPDASALFGWNWHEEGQITGGNVAPYKALTTHIVFADIDGDGRSDYLVVPDEGGPVYGWLNKGGDTGGGWVSRGQIASGQAAYGDRVLFADINGDGKDDYLVVHLDGSLDAWLNNGTDGH